MKKLILFNLLVLSFMFVSIAQQVTVNFQPKNDSDKIDSIYVTNLTKGQTVKLDAGETLVFTLITSAIHFTHNGNQNGYLYPNPFYESSMLVFSTYEPQEVVISIFTMSGQFICKHSQSLFPGIHSFWLQFPSNGLYHVVVKGNKKLLSYKAVAIGRTQQMTNIRYMGSGELSKHDFSLDQLKSAQYEKTLNYSEGDVVHYTVFSGDNITVISDSPTTSRTIEVETAECKDPDNRSYKTVKIGNQWWMAENLAFLPEVSPASTGSNTTKHYYVYEYNGTDINAAKATENYSIFGVLYNWPAAMDGAGSSNTSPSGIRGICPVGWHLPSVAEWTQLEEYLADNGYNYDGSTGGGRNKIAKSLAASALWNSSSDIGDVGENISANNKSGFSGLPGGRRGLVTFHEVGEDGQWWTATEYSAEKAWKRSLRHKSRSLISNSYYKEVGYSVRCLRD